MVVARVETYYSGALRCSNLVAVTISLQRKGMILQNGGKDVQKPDLQCPVFSILYPHTYKMQPFFLYFPKVPPT